MVNRGAVLGGGGQQRGGIEGRRSTEGRYWGGEVVNRGAVLGGGGQRRGGIGGEVVNGVAIWEGDGQ